MTLDQTVDDADQDFEFNSASFYPLNGQLLGAANPSANNQYFTMEVGFLGYIYRDAALKVSMLPPFNAGTSAREHAPCSRTAQLLPAWCT